jgi:hypothetical protein
LSNWSRAHGVAGSPGRRFRFEPEGFGKNPVTIRTHDRRAGDPLKDVKVLEQVSFVMKGGTVVRGDSQLR